MPAKSKAMNRFMAAVASGSIKKEGLSKLKAKEFLTPTAGLPESKQRGAYQFKSKSAKKK